MNPVDRAALKAAEGLIAAYRDDPTDLRLNAAWESLCALWEDVGVLDDPDEDDPFLRLCFRLVCSLGPDTFDPESEDQEFLEAVALEVYSRLPVDRGVFPGSGAPGEPFWVDMVAGQLLRERPQWLVPDRRLGPKVGRNDPCPCGSRKKHKRCCLERVST